MFVANLVSSSIVCLQVSFGDMYVLPTKMSLTAGVGEAPKGQ